MLKRPLLSISRKAVLKSAAAILFVLITVGAVSYAGSLTPPGSVSATFYTLTDIYNLVNSNTTTTEGNHDVNFDDALSGSGYTLTQIYDALTGLVTPGTILSGNTYLGVAGTYDATSLTAGVVKAGVAFGIGLTGAYPSATYPLPDGSGTADLESSGGNISSANGAIEWWQSSGTRMTATLDFSTLSNVCDTDTSNGSAGTLSVTSTAIVGGNTFCGVEGLLLKNMFNGSSSTYPGGSQGEYGVEDYNAALGVPGDRYATPWTTCDVGNNYCGTGDSGALIRDDASGLIWSQRCSGSGCSSFNDGVVTTYSWDNSGGNNNSRTANQLCSDHAGWELPHQKQLMQAYINGAAGNLPNETSATFWSSTTVSTAGTSAWRSEIIRGRIDATSKTTATRIRCVWAGI